MREKLKTVFEGVRFQELKRKLKDGTPDRLYYARITVEGSRKEYSVGCLSRGITAEFTDKRRREVQEKFNRRVISASGIAAECRKVQKGGKVKIERKKRLNEHIVKTRELAVHEPGWAFFTRHGYPPKDKNDLYRMLKLLRKRCGYLATYKTSDPNDPFGRKGGLSWVRREPFYKDCRDFRGGRNEVPPRRLVANPELIIERAVPAPVPLPLPPATPILGDEIIVVFVPSNDLDEAIGQLSGQIAALAKMMAHVWKLHTERVISIAVPSPEVLEAQKLRDEIAEKTKRLEELKRLDGVKMAL